MIRPPRVVGRRGTFLLFLAMVDIVFALSLWRPAPAAAQTPTIRFLANIAPLQGWAVLWLVVGAVCLVGAFAHRLDRLAFTAAAAVKSLWGAAYLFGWIVAGLPRGWVASVVWLGFAAVVMVIAGWPEPPVAISADDDR